MNIMLESHLEASEIPVLAHGTCIEGGILPVVAMKSLLGSPSKDYYLQKKTVTLDVVLSPEDEKRLDKAMRSLVFVAKYIGRVIRLTSNTTANNILEMDWFRMVPVNYSIRDLGLVMVEGNYYRRAFDWFQITPRTTNIISIISDNSQQLRDLVATSNIISTVDELVFKVSELESLDANEIGLLAGEELGYRDGTWIRPFICLQIRQEKAACLALCDSKEKL
mmetsp:Transcript_19151/g.28353  ORF Transcript_19151/g.28353 Transcript_19151/m.28353 type:complete len:222 (+) Transcript_19151:1-666(+)